MFAGWNPPPGLFARLPRLRAAFALGAGVDALLRHDDLAPTIPLVRLLDAGMAAQMVEYALYGVLTWQRRFHDYAAQQAHALWLRQPPRMREETRIGVLGLGEMGGTVARALADLGYPVAGWSRTPKSLPGIDCRHGDHGLDRVLAGTDVLVTMLPTTPATQGLLDARRLSRLRPGAFVVHCSRGDQLDVDALLAALDSGQLGGALLDVFAIEPLPADSPLWAHPKVRITPHVAAVTLPGPAVAQIVDNIRALRQGDAMTGIVDRHRAY
jgi:glyoxylate/hydroxypyruvate reductase